MEYLFKIQEFTEADKEIFIDGPNIHLSVYYDDVNQDQVKKDTLKLVEILNLHWNCCDTTLLELHGVI